MQPPQPLNIDQELAEVLTEQYLGYATMTEEFPLLETEWVLEKLRAVFDVSDLELMIDDDYGRGLLMGQLITLHAFESLNDDADEES